MNLTGQQAYQKGQKRRSRGKARPPNAMERKHWGKVGKLTCAATWLRPAAPCAGYISIHHCGTHMGNSKDHMKVLPLCFSMHHLGPEGIDGKLMSAPEWENKHGTEEELLALVPAKIAEREALRGNGT